VSEPAVVAAAGLLTGVLTATAARPVLKRLQRTRRAEDEPDYAELGTATFTASCGSAAAGGAALAWGLLPPALLPAWTVLATVGVLLVAVDARTTWLPWRLTRVAWVLMALALLAGLLLGAPATVLLRAGVGAAAAGLLYLIAWAVTRGGFGFGDVRFAPLLGAAAAGHSWTLLGWSLVLGTVVGGVQGLFRLVRGRRDPFPYGPAMLIGSYLALLALPAAV